MRGARIRVEPMSPPVPGYDVIVEAGALERLPDRIAAAASADRYAVITPDALAETHGATVLESLRSAGLPATLLTFPDGETYKTRETWATLTDAMLEHGFGRDACVIALGGGVTGDIAGFVAATFLRGIPFVQVPTTLLAMIDASVGGKTGVDTRAGKNLVGAFHAPRIVIIDPAALDTLPDPELRSGMAEAVKHGAILDAAYFAWIGHNVDALRARDHDAIEYLIARSVELKSAVVAEDPHESARRAILNFGHTVGHALEHCTAYGMPHGFGVAAGMCAEAALGEAAGITNPGTASDLAQLVDRLGLPTRLDADADSLIAAMRVDKKVRRSQPRFVLLREIGECAPDDHGEWTRVIDSDIVKRTLQAAAAADDHV